MDLTAKLAALEGKDTALAYQTLQELEALSEESDALYAYTGHFIDMIGSRRYAVRVRGIRLLCKQAKWDTERQIDQNFERVLAILEDEKPTAVRQALAALRELAPYKRELCGMLCRRVLAIDCGRYQETMQGLIAKDVQALVDEIDRLQD